MRIGPFLPAALTGVFLIGSFPPYSFYPLAWIALVPLFFALSSKWSAQNFILAFFAMTVFFLESLHWLSIFGWMAWIGSALYQALFPAFWGFAAAPFLRRGKGSFLNILFPPVSFVAMEAVRNLGPLAMPWGDLAYTQWRFLPMIQTASLTGSLGVTFVVLLVNLFVFYAIRERNWKWCAAALLSLGIPLGWGWFRLQATFVPEFKVALLQTHDRQIEKWSQAHAGAMLAELDRLVTEAKRGHPLLVVFPETAFAGYLEGDPELKRLVTVWSKNPDCFLAVGTLLASGGKPQNAIVLVGPGGISEDVYAKIKLVPFGEYLPVLLRPLRGRWHILDPIVDFRPGEVFSIFKAGQAHFGTLICFESSFGWMARALARRGANFLVVSTNDAWFFGTPAQEMHAVMAIFRSVETGRSTLQAGNTGISLLTDPRGRVLAWQGANGSKVVSGSIPLSSEETGYDRIGDAFSIFCLIATLGFLFAAVLRIRA